MKKLTLALIALTAAVPAAAQDFAGPRVGVNLGVADDDFLGTETVTWGVEAGYDWNLNGTIVGAQIEYQDDFDDEMGRELAATARVGMPVGQRSLVYVSAGYSNLDFGPQDIDGVRIGGGLEISTTSGALFKLEQRYGNYSYGVEMWQTLVGVGYRF